MLVFSNFAVFFLAIALNLDYGFNCSRVVLVDNSMSCCKLPSVLSGKIYCPRNELNLKYTLNGGQSFRWKETPDGHWTGVFAERVWKIFQEDDFLVYKVFSKTFSNKDGKVSNKRKSSENKVMDSKVNEDLLVDYLRLNVSLKELYSDWSEADSNFREVSETFYGIRIINQDPVENIFSFICSSNNFISRISSMVEKLCTFYGDKICDIDGEEYYSFPSVEALAKPGVSEKLRESGFGYRAKYIYESAVKIDSLGGKLWLNKLKEMSYNDAKTELMKLSGIGAKVADCICLMSLGHMEAVPVDTHVFQIASLHYLPHLKSCKSVTPKIYDEIGNHFRSLYGSMAGWAHTILFCADLKKFQIPDVIKRKAAASVKSTKKKK